MLVMKRKLNINKQFYRYQHIILASVFSFILGSIVTVNLAQINKTCKLDDTDREYNVMKNSKLKNDELVILIFSSPDNLSKRNTIRLTWLKLQQTRSSRNIYTFTHYFVLGRLGLNDKQHDSIVKEQSLHDDVLFLPMHDGYNNLTEKILKSFVWLKEQRDIGFNFKYVLKCDDDTFVRIKDLLHEIAAIENFYLNSNVILEDPNNDNFSPFLRANVQINKNVPKKDLNLYWGYFSGKTHIKKAGKWRESEWILCDNYLPYALGGGYVISKNLVYYIANNAGSFRWYNSEDVSVGTWLSPVTNILRVHDIRFDTEWISRGCQNNYLITHHISEKKMHEFYNNIIIKGNLCPTENLTRVPYLYNWTMPPSKCCSQIPKKNNLIDNIMSFF